jgi:phage terminase large subunit-like protein
MAIDKVQGLRSKYNSVDEWLSGDTREDVITALKQGATKFEDPVLVAISSEGTVRNGVGDTIKIELAAILKGDSEQWNVSIFHYKLDDVKEVKNPAMWLKANPNLGITVSYDTYAADVKRAEDFPSVRNEILAKRFGLPMEGFTFYFTYDEIQVHEGVHTYDGMPCALGVDLSRGDDFCAFTWLFPLRRGVDVKDLRFGIKTRSYITRKTLEMLPGAKRAKYQEFIDEGTLIIMEGTVLDMMDVYEDVSAHWENHRYDIRVMGYDPYNSTAFIDRYTIDWGPYFIQKVIQGPRTESVPLGELKILARLKALIFDELIMMYTMGNAVAWEDSNGNRKLVKRRSDEKIDNVAALLDAYVAFKDNPDQFD